MLINTDLIWDKERKLVKNKMMNLITQGSPCHFQINSKDFIRYRMTQCTKLSRRKWTVAGKKRKNLINHVKNLNHPLHFLMTLRKNKSGVRMKSWLKRKDLIQIKTLNKWIRNQWKNLNQKAPSLGKLVKL